MPEVKSRVGIEELRSIDSSTFVGSYQNLGTPFGHPARLIKITNDSTVDATISYDGGTTDHEYLPSGSFLLLDFNSNAVPQSIWVLPKDTQISVKGSAGTGNVYLSVYYVF